MPTVELYQQRALSYYNALDWGLVGDGATDNTTNLQALINAVNTAGGGQIYFPAGTYLISAALTFYGGIDYIGAGQQETSIKLKNASNTDMFVSNNFASLTGTNSTSGEHNFSFRNLTIDGNKANQTTGTGTCLKIYGYYYTIENVVLANSFGQGMYSEWSTSGTAPSPYSMETHIHNFKIFNTGDIGLVFDGPHDSSIEQGEIIRTTKHGIQLGPNASGTKLVDVHCWSQTTGQSALNWLVEANNVQCLNCYADSSDTVGVAVLGTAFQWIGGLIGGSLSNASAVGMQIGQTAGGTPFYNSYNQSAGLTTAVSVSNGIIICIMSNWLGTNGVINFANDGGNMILAMITPGAGASTTYGGTPSTSGVYMWSSRGLSGNKNHPVALMPGVFADGQGSAQPLSNASTINISGFGTERTTETGNVTGIILAPGQYPGQKVWVANESNFTVTFDVVGTSNVSNGTTCVIAALAGKSFVWDSGTSHWYPTS